MAILSIQSRVVVGHVGNSAAVPALQRMGHDVWAVDTVTYSNHPAHGRHTGPVRPAAEIRELLQGLAAGGRLAACCGILSGYLGMAEHGAIVLDALSLVRAARANAVFLCDPVMGDSGKIYVDSAIVEFFRTSAATNADILTPNAFEASLLTGEPVACVEQALNAARTLHKAGSGWVVVTGIAAGNEIATLGFDRQASWLVATPHIDRPAFGAGDLFAAVLLAHRLAGRSLADSLERTVSSVYSILSHTAADGAPDLSLVAALDTLASPVRNFQCCRL